MALPTSGTITAAMINVELKRAAGAPFDMNGAAERKLAKRLSGSISFSDFVGKSNSPTALASYTVTPDLYSTPSYTYFVDIGVSGAINIYGRINRGFRWLTNGETTGGTNFEYYVVASAPTITVSLSQGVWRPLGTFTAYLNHTAGSQTTESVTIHIRQTDDHANAGAYIMYLTAVP